MLLRLGTDLMTGALETFMRPAGLLLPLITHTLQVMVAPACQPCGATRSTAILWSVQSTALMPTPTWCLATKVQLTRVAMTKMVAPWVALEAMRRGHLLHSWPQCCMALVILPGMRTWMLPQMWQL